MRKWLPLLAICLGTFMLLVDVTIVTVALPDIGRALHASASGLQWVMDGYALVLAALLLGAGSAADLAGRRRVYLLGLVLFAIASLACSYSSSVGVLDAARMVQGLGGAAMLATTVALLNVCYQGKDRAVAFGVWGAVSGAAAAAGPILGGLLTQHASWHWIFLVNLPVSVVTVVLSRLVLPESHGDRTARVDIPGMVAFTIGIAALTYGLTRASTASWTASGTLGLFALAAVALIAFVLVERVRQHPMLDLSLFRRPAFVGVMATALLAQAAAFAYLPYTSLWLQSVLGKRPVAAGLYMVPLSIAAFVVAAVFGRLSHGRSPRLAIGGGTLLVGVGALWQATISAGSSGAALLPGLIVSGVGAGLVTPTLASAALSAVPRQRSGMASGAVNTFRQLGYALGIAVFGSVFTARATGALRGSQHGGAAHVGHALAAGQAPALVSGHVISSHVAHAVAASSLAHVCLVAAIIGIGGGVLALVLIRADRPNEATPAPHRDRPAVAAID